MWPKRHHNYLEAETTCSLFDLTNTTHENAEVNSVSLLSHHMFLDFKMKIH